MFRKACIIYVLSRSKRLAQTLCLVCCARAIYQALPISRILYLRQINNNYRQGMITIGMGAELKTLAPIPSNTYTHTYISIYIDMYDYIYTRFALSHFSAVTTAAVFGASCAIDWFGKSATQRLQPSTRKNRKSCTARCVPKTTRRG